MKKIILLTSLIIIGTSSMSAQGLQQTFSQHKFKVKTPCKLEQYYDATVDFAYKAPYGNDKQGTAVMYQVGISSILNGYIETLTGKAREDAIELFLNSSARQYYSTKTVKFKGLNARIMNYNVDGFEGKVLLFVKAGKAYLFNVMAMQGTATKFENWISTIEFI